MKETSAVSPTIANEIWNSTNRLNVFADPWTTPPEAFFDIYDLIDDLCQPADHIQLEGRRGTGKTMLMVNAYLKLRREFEAARGYPPYPVIAIYIDLSQEVGARQDYPPMIRALMIYRQILGLILTASQRPKGRRGQRFWGLQDFLNARPHWFRKLLARWRLRQYRSYIQSLGDRVYKDADFQEIQKWSDHLKAAVGASSKLDPADRLPLSADIEAGAGHDRTIETRLQGVYQMFGGKVRGLLERLLQAMEVEKLIIFLDEWSGSSISPETQPFLYEQLMQTFPSGGNVVIRLATIPGSTQLTFADSPPRTLLKPLDNYARSRSSWMRDRLLRLLILNLAAYVGPIFPESEYLSEYERNAGFPKFKEMVFQDKAAIDEMALAGENLPRQMLILFMEACRLRKRHTPTQKLSVPIIRQAAKNHFIWYLDNHMRKHHRVYDVFCEILGAGRRMFDVRRVPGFYAELDWLTDKGVMFRCDINLPERRDRYYLSYPAEVYRLYSGYTGMGQEMERLSQLEIEEISICETGETPPFVNLSSLVNAQAEARKP